MARRDFDVDAFLAQPLAARVAAAGPTVRPTWYLWEDGAFWIIVGPWGKLAEHVRADPALALVVDVSEPATGEMRQVVAKGRGELLPFDPERARRKLTRYLGEDEARWPERFQLSSFGAQVHLLRMRPDALAATDLSYQPVRKEGGAERISGSTAG